MAQVDYFLKIDGVDGESTDVKHKGEIEPLSFSWLETVAVIQSGGGGGAAAGKVKANDFQFVKRVDKASPVLMLACATGQRFKQAVLVARKAGVQPFEFLAITLQDVLLTSYQIGGAVENGSGPTEQISLLFATFEMSYREQKPDGSAGAEIKRGFDFVQNKTI